MTGKTLLASQVLSRSGLGGILRRSTGRRGFVVLNYHRVGVADEAVGDPGVYSGTIEQFERELRMLKRDCDVITPEDIRDLPARGRGSYAMITFDDGYRDNYELAYPALKAVGLPAVFFIATGFIDRPRLSWWDEIAWMVRHARHSHIGATGRLPIAFALTGDRQTALEQVLAVYKQLSPDCTEPFLDELAEATGTGRAPEALAEGQWMTWDMVREMRDGGMLIGGHTVNHPILATLSREQQEQEIRGCAAALQAQLGEPMRLFSYPRGKPDSFNEETRACLYEAHVQYAFSYYGGMNRPETLDPYDVRRVPVDADTALEHFEAMVTLPQIFA